MEASPPEGLTSFGEALVGRGGSYCGSDPAPNAADFRLTPSTEAANQTCSKIQSTRIDC